MRKLSAEEIAPHIMAELQRNERQAVLARLHIRVERLGHVQGAAFCTVRQLSRGFLFGHRLGTNELIGHAQRALAPLQALGLVPLVTAIPWGSSRRMPRPTGHGPGPDPFGIKAALAAALADTPPSQGEREAPAA